MRPEICFTDKKKKKQAAKQYRLYASLEIDKAMEVDMDIDIDLHGEQQTQTQR